MTIDQTQNATIADQVADIYYQEREDAIAKYGSHSSEARYDATIAAACQHERKELYNSNWGESGDGSFAPTRAFRFADGSCVEITYSDAYVCTAHYATLNLTQHTATDEQRADGVVDVNDADREKLSVLLDFDHAPSREEIEERARQITELAKCYQAECGMRRAMLGGAPWLMAVLELALYKAGFDPVSSFGLRESAEVVQPDGSIKKRRCFGTEDLFIPKVN